MSEESKPKTAKKAPKAAGKRGQKAAAIRAYMNRNPTAGPSAVVAALKKRGIAISAAQVSNLKTYEKNKAQGGATRGRPARGGRKAGGRPAAGDAVRLSHLLAAQEFAAEVGGVEAASALLNTLAKLK